jgi:hypothetical protein
MATRADAQAAPPIAQLAADFMRWRRRARRSRWEELARRAERHGLSSAEFRELEPLEEEFGPCGS